MRKLLLALALLWAPSAYAANSMCPTRPSGDSTNACASTAFVTTGIAADFASPPPLGNVTPNSVAATTLSASGLVSGVGFTNLFASPPPLGNIAPNSVGATSLTIGAPGLVGDGTTNNATAFQAALTSIASGGIIHLPCGVFKSQSALSTTITAAKTVVVEGSGQGCTTVYFSGAINGFTFNFGLNSAVILRGMSIVTDSVGGQAGVTFTWPGPGSGFGVTFGASVIEDVNMNGNNGQAGSEYWGIGVNIVSVSNVMLDRFFYQSNNSNLGDGVLVSSPSALFPAEVINFVNSDLNLCDKGIIYGAHTQGIAIVNTNFACNTSIQVPSGLVADLDQLSITNSQFNPLLEALDIGSPLASLLVSNNIFIVEPNAVSIGFETGAAPDQFIISNNTFTGVDTTTTTGIAVASTSPNVGAIIKGNIFQALHSSITYVSGASALVTGNQFANVANLFLGDPTIIAYGNTPETQYSIANLPTCGVALSGVRLFMHDTLFSAAPTYHGVVTGAGATTANTPVYCDVMAPAWKYD
jgi:hypothetical protein